MGCNDNFEPNEEECNGCINWKYGTCMYEERRRISNRGGVKMNNEVGRQITEEEVRKIAEIEMTRAVMKNIDSAFIFNYVRNLETKIKKLDKIKEYAKGIVDDDIYEMNCCYDVNGTQVRRDLEELLNDD